MKVLLIEDDIMIGEDIQIALHDEGIAVDWARDGKTCESAFKSHAYDALLLDLGLPYKDGIKVLQSLRARGDKIPVLIITARDTLADRVNGLNSGADDYLVKPFEFEELIARLRALVRRVRDLAEPNYRKGEVSVDLHTHQVIANGKQLPLSGREWAILDALISRPGTILSRSQLEKRLYGWSGVVESNAVEVYIHSLRKKLGPDFIVNVRGLGYKVEKI
jgi:DNA-binding response OmpR family regulator